MDKKPDGPLEAFGPLFRLILTLFIGGLGLLICGQLGALAYPTPPGVGALVSGILGAVISGLLGFFITGFWKDFLPKEDASTIWNVGQRKLTGVHESDQLICTVKQVNNVGVHGRLYFAAEHYMTPELGSTLSRPELFVELECAHNPTKVTCVRKDGIFNEQFILQVSREDRELMITVKDQNVVGSTSVGYVSLNVDRDILSERLPCSITKPLGAGAGFALRQPMMGTERAEIELTFADAAIHAEKVEVHEKVADLHGKHIDPELALLKEGDQTTPRGGFNGDYGAVEFLTALSFDKGQNLGGPRQPARSKPMPQAA